MNDAVRPESSQSLPERLRAEYEVQQRERNIQMLPFLYEQIQNRHQQFSDFERRLSDLEQRLKPEGGKQEREQPWYFLPLLAVIAFTAFIISRGWAEKPSVSITYNVGEIIGGTLAGIGALMAGVAYWFHRFRE